MSYLKGTQTFRIVELRHFRLVYFLCTLQHHIARSRRVSKVVRDNERTQAPMADDCYVQQEGKLVLATAAAVAGQTRAKTMNKTVALFEFLVCCYIGRRQSEPQASSVRLGAHRCRRCSARPILIEK